jgi:hypothetical protein
VRLKHVATIADDDPDFAAAVEVRAAAIEITEYVRDFTSSKGTSAFSLRTFVRLLIQYEAARSAARITD